jgi:cytochrome c oxidase assembly protein subunit 15
LLLKPLIVTLHLLGGLSILGLLWWLSLEPQRHESAAREKKMRRLGIVGAAVLTLQIALGGWTSTNYAAVACPDFPTCQGHWWPSMDFRDAFVLSRGLEVDYEGGVLGQPARAAIHVTHRLGALIAGSILLCLGAWTLLGRVGGRVRVAGGLLLLAVLAQISIGIATVRWGVPLALATLHNAGAALLVIAMATLLRALWPAPSVGMLPLGRGDATR